MSSNRPESTAKVFSFLDKNRRCGYYLPMERAEDLRQRVRRERQIIERLRTAAVHLADAET